MAIADLATYINEMSHPKEFQPITVATITTIAGRWYDLWTSTPPVGTAPTTAAVPTSATTGTLGQQDSTTGTLGIVAGRLNLMNPGVYLLIDRLSHQGGLSGTVTTVGVTTNLPTSALTRYTDGAGVMLGISIYSQIGTTATTITCSYTNQAGTSGQVSPAIAIGGTGFREAGRVLFVPLAAGDTGVRSVQSSTLTATTGTAGAFGYTLFKPLAAIIVDEVNGVSICDLITGKWGGGLPEVVDGAALCLMGCSTSTNLMGSGTILFAEW